MPPPTAELDELCLQTLRVLAIDAVQAAKSGHPGMPLGAAPMAHALWTRHLRFNPTNPNWPDRDRFVLSAGHGSMLLYALLHLTGYDLPLEELKRFRQLGSRTPGHPERGLTPGVEMATGPLGQGFATAVGMAMAERFLAARYNRPGHGIVDHRTFVIASDGDLMEGISHEAASLAGHQRLAKLIVLYDDNGITIDGGTQLAFTEDVCARFDALGWHTQRVDGMDVAQVDRAIQTAVGEDRPSLVAARTVIGFGSPNKAGSAKSHGAPLGPEEVALTKQALGAPPEPEFWVAPEAAEFYGSFAEKGGRLESEWSARWEAYRREFPSEARELEDAWSGKAVQGIVSCLPTFSDPIQTRQASGKCLQALAARIPTLVGGSADLAESNNTLIDGSPPMQHSAPAGRNVYFGVREHAMAAAVNGMNLHGGVFGYGASFLIFSDYCRPSLRLAALMQCPSIFVFTHDSIGVGEDGPTHQPIEHYASLRAMPNMNFCRPADGNETAALWAVALERRTGPTILALTRQAVPSLTPSDLACHPARNGAYILAESSGKPEAVLIGTGSEVALAMETRSILEARGVPTRVVSMPSWLLFESQTQTYREQVLPPEVFTVSIEAGATFGWDRYADLAIGLDRYGESAPYADLMKHFGFSAEEIARKVMARLRDALGV